MLATLPVKSAYRAAALLASVPEMFGRLVELKTVVIGSPAATPTVSVGIPAPP